MSLKFGSVTNVGLKRRNNQDSFAVVRGETLNGELDALFVIADGMGGALGGEVASEIVVKTLPAVVTEHLSARNGNKEPVDTAVLLEAAIRESHRKVRQRQAGDAQLSGMGTTCVAAILDANQLIVANVGDSRAYLLRGGRLKQVTQDHSSVWEQVQAGIMTPDEARTSRFRNQITRAVGSDFNARPDIFRMELQDGDSVLLCSDGLSSEVQDGEIARLLAGVQDPQTACESLVEAALGAGGRDNVTVIALRYGAFSPLTLEQAHPPVPLEAAFSSGEPEGVERVSSLMASSVFPEEDQASVPLRGRRVSPLLIGLLFVLAVAAGGEGYALVRLNQDLVKLRKVPPRVVAVPQERPTDYELSYSPPVVMARKPVRDTPIAADEDGGALVTTIEGTLVRIDPIGRVTPLPDQGKIAGKMAAAVPRDAFIVTSDVSGNRYQINPGARVIWKYDAEGSLKNNAIGKGALTAPTALAVDNAGSLYVIDDRRVKKIAAATAAPTPVADQTRR